MRGWLGEELTPPPEAEGVAALVTAWLTAFGPGTDADLAWWLGLPRTAVRRALTSVGAGPSTSKTREAERLGAWLDGVVVQPRFPSPLSRQPLDSRAEEGSGT